MCLVIKFSAASARLIFGHGSLITYGPNKNGHAAMTISNYKTNVIINPISALFRKSFFAKCPFLHRKFKKSRCFPV